MSTAIVEVRHNCRHLKAFDLLRSVVVIDVHVHVI